MRYKVDIMLGKDGLELPLNYREILQAILYGAMPVEEATRAHEQVAGQRKWQQFTFSRLFGDLSIDMKRRVIHFQTIYFYFSCRDELLAQYMAKQLALGIRIHSQSYKVQVSQLPPAPRSQHIRMLAPVTVRKTDRDTGKTTYFEPNTMEFSQAVYQNLVRKYRYFYDEDYDGPFAIVADEKTIKGTNAKFENLYIKGYMGDFQLVVSEKAFDLLYQVGLGEKNAQGFGMFEVEE